MKKTILFLGWCFALSAQAIELKGCEDFKRTAGIPSNYVFNPQELQVLETESRKQTDLAWPAILGLMHICGVGVAKDVDKGLQILQTSSREGEISSLMMEVGFYAGFFGGAVDLTKLIEVLQYPANAGKVEAQLMLAKLYADGRVIPSNPAEVERWYLKAAAQGNVEAQNALGYIYFNRGKYREALPWLQMAAVQGNKHTQWAYNELLKIVEAGYLPLPKGNVEASESEEVHLPLGRSDPKLEKTLRANVLDGKPESKLALAAFLKMTEWEQPRLVGSMGGAEGTPTYKAAEEAVNRLMRERNNEAVEWLQKAAQQGNTLAAYKLGTANWYGSMGVSDEREGLRLIRAAAAGGEPDAVYWLARAYQQGTGLPISFVAAYALYFHFEKLQSQGTLQLAAFVPPSDVVLKDAELHRAQQLALALAEPGQFLLVLDNAVVGEGR
jgi:TPR repeat protein